MRTPLMTASLAALALSACNFGFGFGGSYNYGGGGYDSYSPPPDSYSNTDSVPFADPLCTEAPVPLAGTTAADIVGTWQDWEGGTYQVVQFGDDGSVKMWLPPPFDKQWVGPPPAGPVADAGTSVPIAPADGGAGVHEFTRAASADAGTTDAGTADDGTLGHYVADSAASSITITWSDGTTELLTAAFISYTGCTMVTLTSATPETSRLPNIDGQLERVACTPAQTTVGTVK